MAFKELFVPFLSKNNVDYSALRILFARMKEGIHRNTCTDCNTDPRWTDFYTRSEVL